MDNYINIQQFTLNESINYKQIRCGLNSISYINNNGEIYSAGDNTFGQIGSLSFKNNYKKFNKCDHILSSNKITKIKDIMCGDKFIYN